MSITLQLATKELLHDYYKGFVNDPDIFMDMSRFHTYQYDPHKVDMYYEAKAVRPDRRMFIVMNDDIPVGELQLKNIDPGSSTCELSIHLQNDSVKNKGFGTQAEKLALRYAFEVLELKTVFADSVLKNLRSQHVLEKVGFRYIREDDVFRYYRYDRDWQGTGLADRA